MLRKRWAERADLNRCILRSRRCTARCEFSARLFFRSPCSCGQSQTPERAGVRAQLVGDQQLGSEALLPRKSKQRDLLIKLKQVAKLLQEGGGCGWHRPA